MQLITMYFRSLTLSRYACRKLTVNNEFQAMLKGKIFLFFFLLQCNEEGIFKINAFVCIALCTLLKLKINFDV